jgi:hypothetical protein
MVDKILMTASNKNEEKITPAIAVISLANEGIIISEEQAAIILEFMYEMAESL